MMLERTMVTADTYLGCEKTCKTNSWTSRPEHSIDRIEIIGNLIMRGLKTDMYISTLLAERDDNHDLMNEHVPSVSLQMK